jgi:hypothetical protein
MTEYLSVKALSEKIGYKVQSIYNMIHNGTFVLNKHYFKPTPKKILFKWDAVKQWIEGAAIPNIVESNAAQTNCTSPHKIHNSNPTNKKHPQNNINI